MKNYIILLEISLESFETTNRGEDVNITLPYTKIEECFTSLNETYREILAYLINPDLFELIKHSDKFEYYEEIQHKSIRGRRFTLYGKFCDSIVIVDTSLYNHNYIWFLQSSNSGIQIKHKLIIS